MRLRIAALVNRSALDCSIVFFFASAAAS